MASITGFTAERLQQIEDTTITGGSVNQIGNLVLTTRYGAQIDAGYVKGNTGPIGPDRQVNAGMIQAFGGSTPPAGWMFCDGAAISRTTYAELFAAIGTAYGIGNGTTTFNLPDLRGRVAVGLDNAQIEFDNLGEKGGAKTHTLTAAEMPSHTHTVKGFAGFDDLNFTGSAGAFAASDAVTPYDQQTQSTGGGGAHNNLQPYQVVQFIISIGNAGAVVVVSEDYVGRGTTAQRDTLFGVPGDDVARVALANRKILWYNTDNGWEESYYAAAGKPGQLAPPLIPSASSGWYPTGPGPMVIWEPLVQSTLANATFVGGWSWLRRRGGTAWFDSADGLKIDIKRHGRYDVRIWTVQFTGTDVPNYHLRVTGADGASIDWNVDGNAFPRISNLYTRMHVELDDFLLVPPQRVGLYLASGGGGAVHVGSIAPRGQFLIRYVGPPFATD